MIELNDRRLDELFSKTERDLERNQAMLDNFFQQLGGSGESDSDQKVTR